MLADDRQHRVILQRIARRAMLFRCFEHCGNDQKMIGFLQT